MDWKQHASEYLTISSLTEGDVRHIAMCLSAINPTPFVFRWFSDSELAEAISERAALSIIHEKCGGYFKSKSKKIEINQKLPISDKLLTCSISEVECFLNSTEPVDIKKAVIKFIETIITYSLVKDSSYILDQFKDDIIMSFIFANGGIFENGICDEKLIQQAAVFILKDDNQYMRSLREFLNSAIANASGELIEVMVHQTCLKTRLEMFAIVRS